MQWLVLAASCNIKLALAAVFKCWIKQDTEFPLFSSYFQLDTALLRIYNYLQRFAVGLEEVVLDQALFDGEFIQEFNEAEYKLKAVSQDVLILWQLLERKYFCFIYHPLAAPKLAGHSGIKKCRVVECQKIFFKLIYSRFCANYRWRC